MSARRILICSSFYPPDFVGGAELIAHQYARCLARLGHEVLVFAGSTRSFRGRHATRRSSYDGVSVVRVRLNHEDFSPDFVNFAHPDIDRYCAALIDDFQPTVVHCHNLIGLSAGILRVARARGLRTIITLHDHWGFCYRNTLMKKPGEICSDYARCAECLPFVGDGRARGLPIRMRNDFLAIQLGAADFLVSPSRYLADTYIQAGFSPERVRVIPYGIDLSRFAPLQQRREPTRLRFTFVGYFGWHKGVDTLVKALNYLTDMRGRFEMSLVGEGELLAATRQYVTDHNWEEFVRLPGKVDHAKIETVYRETDVLLLPSIWPENQPVSITEAMAAGIPVIVSRIGGTPELVEDGCTGFLIEPGNPLQLAEKIKLFIENRMLVREFGSRAAQLIAGNTVESRIAEYVALYDAARPVSDPRPASGLIVVCVGKRFSRTCSLAMEALRLNGEEPLPRFMMREWIDDDLLASASLVWVVDSEVGIGDVVALAAGGAPLLVPATSHALRQLCIERNCGLYYGDEYEAAVCLEFLLRNSSIREALGRNAIRAAT